MTFYYLRRQKNRSKTSLLVKHFKLLLVGMLLVLGFSAKAQVNYRHFVLAGRIDLSEDRFIEAIRNFNTAIQYKEDHFEAYFLRGIAKFNLSDYQGAADDFSKTLQIHPLYVRALHYRGVANDRLGNYADAMADFAKALSIDPFNADLHVANGATKMHLNRFEDAIKDYDMALLINPNMAYAYLNRGIANKLLNKPQEALKDLNEAVYHDYFDIEAWIRRGMIHLELNQFDDALTDLNQAIQLDDQSPLAYFQRGITYLQKGDTLAALNDFEKVNMLDPRNALTYYNRALIYSMRKEFDKALPLYDQVIAINPQNVYAYFNRGVVSFQQDQLQPAEADFTSAIKLFPDFAGAYINRSLVRKKLKDDHGSRADYDKAMSIIKALNNDDGNPDSLYAQYADSTYFDKILALESEFVNGDAAATKVQFRDIDILPFENFELSLLPTTGRSKTTTVKHYDDIHLVVYNSANREDYILAYVLQNLNDTSSSQISTISETIQGDWALKTLLLGLAEQRKTNYNRAESIYSQLLRDEKWGNYAQLNQANVLFAKAELVLANEQFDQAITISRRKSTVTSKQLDPVDPNIDPAVGVIQQLLKSSSKMAFAWYNLGNMQLQQKEFQKAIDSYSEAIKYEPHLAEAYYNRALTLLFVGENELACNDLSQAGQLGLTEAYAVIRKYCTKN